MSRRLADVLEIPESRIKVIPMECGGGFGGKIRALVEPLAVLLSRATHRPVSLVMTRREELQAGMPAPGVIIRLKTGVKRDGTPLALEAETVLESGAFSGALLTMSAVFLASVYQWPAFDVRGFEVLTHKPSVAAYRAPLAPQTAFAIDSHMDTIARRLELDPAEYKARYLQHGGDLMANDQPWAVNGASECLRLLTEHPLWRERDAWRASGGRNGNGLRGTGLAVGGWVPNIQPTSATVRLDSDGSLTVVTGSVDIAGTNMGLALIAAEAYGVDIDRVRIVTGDTDSAPLSGVSAGSKTTYTMGASVRDAAAEARRQTSRSPRASWKSRSTTSTWIRTPSSCAACRTARSRSPASANAATRSARRLRQSWARRPTRLACRRPRLPPNWPASRSIPIPASSPCTTS